jgi:hypothetical protein
MTNPVDSDTARLYEVEKDVSLLKKDSEIQTKILDKLDITVENIHDLAQSMHRMVSIHEERFRVQDKENAQLEAQITQRREESVAEVKALQNNINDLETITVNRMEEIKKDLASNRELIVKLTHEPDSKAKSTEDKSVDLLKMVVENWKPIMFSAAFLIGIITHKWDILKSFIGLKD